MLILIARPAVVLLLGGDLRRRRIRSPASATRSAEIPRYPRRGVLDGRRCSPGSRRSIAAYTPRRAYATAAIIARLDHPADHRRASWRRAVGGPRPDPRCCSARATSSMGSTPRSSGTIPDSPVVLVAGPAGLGLSWSRRRRIAGCIAIVRRYQRSRHDRPSRPPRRHRRPSRRRRSAGDAARHRSSTTSRAGTATSSPSTTSSFALGPGVTGLLGPTAPASRRSCTCSPGLLAPSAGAVRIARPAGRRRPVDLSPHRPRPRARGRPRRTSPGASSSRLNARAAGHARPGRRSGAAIATVELTDAADRPIAHVLQGHAPAGQAGRGARPRPADPAARRAVQRHGPAPAAAHDGAAPADGRRGPGDPLLVAHPRGGRASRRRRPRRLRRPAGRVRRLPLDPPADDRPSAHASRSAPPTTGASRRRCSAEPAVFGVELVDGRARRPGLRLRRVRARRRADVPGRPASACSRSGRPTTRSRASSATWSGDDARSRPSSPSRCRGAPRPAPDAAAHPPRRRCRSSSRCSSGSAAAAATPPGILDALGIRTVLPLVALVIGTAALGSEIEDGTWSTCSPSRSRAGHGRGQGPGRGRHDPGAHPARRSCSRGSWSAARAPMPSRPR